MQGHERGLQRLRRSLAEAPKRAIDVFGALFARPIDSQGELLGVASLPRSLRRRLAVRWLPGLVLRSL